MCFKMEEDGWPGQGLLASAFGHGHALVNCPPEMYRILFLPIIHQQEALSFHSAGKLWYHHFSLVS